MAVSNLLHLHIQNLVVPRDLEVLGHLCLHLYLHPVHLLNSNDKNLPIVQNNPVQGQYPLILILMHILIITLMHILTIVEVVLKLDHIISKHPVIILNKIKNMQNFQKCVLMQMLDVEKLHKRQEMLKDIVVWKQ